VLATLTPSEYAQFRGVLGNASGFQSYQYRAVEFVLGNKNAKMMQVFASDPAASAIVRRALEAPSLYDEFLRLLARAGYDIPADVLERDVTLAWTYRPELVAVFAGIYADPDHNWAAYETCEELVDLEDNFQLWRFRHLKTVERIIGSKTGTGGSSGAPFLRRALELTFFPELYAVRTEIPG
jgi:tryptophan 2,3-dioxygenase